MRALADPFLCALLLWLPPVLALGQGTPASLLQIDSLIQRSRQLTNQYEFSAALEECQLAEKLAEAHFGLNSLAYADCCFNHGRILHLSGDYQAAEHWYLQCQKIRQDSLPALHPQYAEVLNNLGFLYWHMADYTRSEPYFLRAYDIRKEVYGTQHVMYAESVHNLAILYYFMGDFRKSEKLHLESREIRERTLGKEHPDYAWTLNNLANLYSGLGNHELAERLHLEAMGIWERTLGDQHPYYAEALNNLGYFYWQQRRYAMAEPLLEEARSIREQVLGHGHPSTAATIHNLALLFKDTGNLGKARDLLLQTLKRKEALVGREHHSYAATLHQLGVLYAQHQDFEQAEVFLSDAQDIRRRVLGERHPEYAQSLLELGLLYTQQQREEEAVATLSQWAVTNRLLMARAAHHLSEQELALYLEEFSGRQARLFHHLAQWAELPAALSSLAYDECLFYKGYLLQTVRKVKLLAQSTPETASLYRQLQKMQRQIAVEENKPLDGQASLPSLIVAANEREKELLHQLEGLGLDGRFRSWQDIQAHLQAGQVGIEFLRIPQPEGVTEGAARYAALLLRADWEAPRWVNLCYEDQLHALWPDYPRQDIKGIGPLLAYQQPSSLYALLWAPLDYLVQHATDIFYAPAGLLHRLPVAAIATPANQYLTDRHLFHQLGSTRQIRELDKATAQPGNAVVFGGIHFNMDSIMLFGPRPPVREPSISFPAHLSRTPRNWASLPWTKVEAQLVDTLLREVGWESQCFQGYEASEEVFRSLGEKSPAPDLIHVATHGFFLPAASPPSNMQANGRMRKVIPPLLRSGLVMAGGNHVWQGGKPFEGQEDGILTALEISQMDLQGTLLVILSACDTGLGDIVDNEGVYGLQRAFKIAGAERILMSLWPVPDFVTQELMITFYQHWLEAGFGVEEAFRSAQQSIRRQYPNPFYWAGFVLAQ